MKRFIKPFHRYTASPFHHLTVVIFEFVGNLFFFCQLNLLQIQILQRMVFVYSEVIMLEAFSGVNILAINVTSLGAHRIRS